MRITQRWAAAALLTLAGACGGGGETTQPAVTAASVTIVPSASGVLTAVTETRTLGVQVRDASSAIITNAPVSWSTSNASVATVTGSGAGATVTSTGNGSTTITATSGSVSTTLVVEVAQQLSTITLTSAVPTLSIGATTVLSVTARDARNAVIAGATGATFATSDRTAAIVDATGTVTAISPGSTSITASLVRDGVTKTATANVTVTAPTSVSSAAAVAATVANVFTPNSVSIALGGEVTWTFAVDHNVLFGSSGAPSDIPTTRNGSVSRTFNTIGTYNYTCTLHAGMNGVVTVGIPNLLALMNGANERPTPNSSSANGAAVIIRNGASASYTVAYQGVASAPTGLHIHAPATSAVNAGIVVNLLTTPLTTTSGVLTGTFSAASILSIGGQPPISMDSLFVLLQTGNAYVNLHTSAFPGGEIRGQTTRP